MTVSKRTRYEVLRRDGYACRYCGAKAPDVKLTVDHVTPVSLGGADTPDNLVACCQDCNAGKSSSSPDADTVAQVSEDAARWAVARDIVLKQWHAERAELAEAKAQFLKAWKCWDSDAQYLPDNWESRVENWLLQGIALEQLFEALEIALANGWVSVSHIFRYMSGIVGRWLDEIDSRIEREVKDGNHGA